MSVRDASCEAIDGNLCPSGCVPDGNVHACASACLLDRRREVANASVGGTACVGYARSTTGM